MAEHTSTPWSYVPTGTVMHGYCQPFAIVQKRRSNMVAGCFGDVSGGPDVGEANAAHICNAVNAHDDLLALAYQYKNDLLHPVTDSGSRARRIEAIDATLAKVTA